MLLPVCALNAKELDIEKVDFKKEREILNS